MNLHLLASDPFNDFLVYVVASIIVLAITAWIFSLFFNVGKRTKLQQIQTMIAIKQAEKEGIYVDDMINSVYHENEKPRFLVAVGKRK